METETELKEMVRIRFYCGSNNTTKRPEKNKAILVLNSYFKGFSILDIKGYWENLPEKSFIVEVITDLSESELLTIREELKTALTQDSVLITSETIKASF